MKHKLFIVASIITLALCAAPRARAQWVSTNGPSGGNVTAIASNGTTLFAATGDGVFFLNDGDTSWTATSLTNTFVQALIVADDGFLVAGTSNGVFFSPDNGNTWPQSNDSQYVFALAAMGSNLIAGTENGIFISADDGNTWTATNYEYDAHALAVIGTNIFTGDYDGGVSISTDNGNTWNETQDTLPFDDVKAFAVNGQDLFAGMFDAPGGVYLTTDNGDSWTPVNSGLPDTVSVNALFISGSYLFAGTDSGVYLSTNNGTSWREVGAGLNDSTDVTTAVIYSFAVNGNNLFAGTQRGVWTSPLPLFANISASAPETTSLTSYPNPFTGRTTINFSSPESGVAEVTIVNLLGTEVARIYEGELDAGEHEFSWDASGMPPGMYECIARAGGSVQHINILCGAK